jgi:hypothetical protein
VNIGSKEVVESLFLVADVGLGLDCLHKGASARQVIIPLQQRAESEGEGERKKERMG